jgi:hypothetical protein
MGGEGYSFSLSLSSALDEGCVVNATPRPLYPRQREVLETELARTGIRSLDRPTRSGSLYRLKWGSPVRNTVVCVAALSDSSGDPGADSFGRTNLH